MIEGNGSKRYILQRINENVFKNILAVDNNFEVLYHYIDKQTEEKWNKIIIPVLIKPLGVCGLHSMVYSPRTKSHFRLFNYVENSLTLSFVESTHLAFVASREFGRFLATFRELDISLLQETIPHFHDLRLRYEQLLISIQEGNINRINQTVDLADELLTNYKYILDIYQIEIDGKLPKRVVHHDCKLSNVLLHKDTNEGICVIDLDTVMAGYFISDLGKYIALDPMNCHHQGLLIGDLFRSQLCSRDEDCDIFSQIEVRMDFFEAIVRGYLHHTKSVLSGLELQYLVYAGEFIIYMQALRFLADYYNNDVYYKTQYDMHNLVRARNQTILLKSFVSKKEEMHKIVFRLLESEHTPE